MGALIHKGFGLYDDDIDISMPRLDFEKLIYLCKKELPPPLFLDYFTTNSDYSLVFAKVKDKTMVYPEQNRETDDHVFIDIFPLDSICGKRKLRLKMVLLTNDIFKNMLFIRNNNKRKTRFQSIYSKILKLVDTKYIIRAYYLLFVSTADTSTVVNYGGRRKRQKYDILNKEMYLPSTTGIFENKMYRIPNNAMRLIEAQQPNRLNDYANKQEYSHIDINRIR